MKDLKFVKYKYYFIWAIFMISITAGILYGMKFTVNEAETSSKIMYLKLMILEYYGYIKYFAITFLAGFTLFAPVSSAITLICGSYRLGLFIKSGSVVNIISDSVALLIYFILCYKAMGCYWGLKNIVPDIKVLFASADIRYYIIDFLVLSGALFILLLIKNLLLII